VDGDHRLASTFRLMREVDYLADRRGDEVLSEIGTACDGARDKDLCEAAIASNSFPGARHLLTTEGDKILQWDGNSALNLLGPIDSIGEAIWLSEAFDYSLDCESRITVAERLFIVQDAYAHWGCLEPQALVTIVVSSHGGVTEVETEGLNSTSCSQTNGPPGFMEPFR
jgi:hypothetical protein